MQVVAFKRFNPFAISSASSNRFLSLAEGLEGLGVKIDLFIIDGHLSKEEKATFGRFGVHGKINYNYIYPSNNTNIWFRRINAYILASIRRFFISRKIRSIISSYENAVIWITDDYALQKAINDYSKKSRQRFFMELNEFLDIHKFHKGNSLQRKLADRSQLFFEKNTLPRLNGLGLMTKTLVSHFKNFPEPKPKLFHLPMTVDLERFDLNAEYPLFPGIKKPYIAYIGVMCNLKDGVDILIDAFSRIEKEFPVLNLYMFGPWHYDLPGHIKQIQNLELTERAFYKGLVDRNEIPNIIMNAEILALPRPDSKQAEGGFPTKLGEYLATARTVCATRVGEIPDYLTDGESVFFADPGSVDSFAEAMRRALSNDEAAKRVGENGRRVAETCFNKAIQAKKLHDFLLSLDVE